MSQSGRSEQNRSEHFKMGWLPLVSKEYPNRMRLSLCSTQTALYKPVAFGLGGGFLPAQNDNMYNIWQTHLTHSPQSPKPQAALLHSGDKGRSLRRCSCSEASPQNAPRGRASTFSHQLSTAGRKELKRPSGIWYLHRSSEPTPDRGCVPHLLQADRVGLWFAVFSQVELLVQLFGQVSMTAFSKQRDFSVELHSSLKNILMH